MDDNKIYKFNPTCKIYLAIAEKGNPAKRGFAVILSDSSGRASVKFTKFLGKCSREEAGLCGALLGLAQAQRLKKEKIEVIIEDNRLKELITDIHTGPEKKLKNITSGVKMKLREFPFSIVRVGAAEELKEVMERAATIFL